MYSKCLRFSLQNPCSNQLLFAQHPWSLLCSTLVVELLSNKYSSKSITNYIDLFLLHFFLFILGFKYENPRKKTIDSNEIETKWLIKVTCKKKGVVLPFSRDVMSQRHFSSWFWIIFSWFKSCHIILWLLEILAVF